MTGYLARLALRSLGRPVSARLRPRADALIGLAPYAAQLDGVGLEHEMPPGEDSGAAAAAGFERAVPLPRPAPSTVVPEGRGRQRPASAFPAPDEAVAAPPPAEAGRTERPSSVDSAPRAVAETSLSARAQSRVAQAEPVQAPSHALASPSPRPGRTAPAARAAPRLEPTRDIPQAIPRARTSGTRAVDGREPAADFPAHAVRIPGAPVDPAIGSHPPRAAAMRPPALHAAQAAVAPEPASISVEIGRIEVRVAPPPAAAARPRPAPEGFERYWRLRNYLDGTR